MSRLQAAELAPRKSTFRVFYLDPMTGWIDHYDEFDAATEDEAIDYARSVHTGQRLELWCGHNRLLQLAKEERR
jgi:hypothetical protein